MSVLDDVRLSQRDPVSRLVAPNRVPLPSLAQQKGASLLERGAEKQARLFPDDAERLERQKALQALLQPIPGSTSLLDFAQSSVLSGAGRISDFSKDRINNLFDTDLDSSQETGFSNQEIADASAGVSPIDRQQLIDDYQAIAEDVSNDEFVDALVKSVKVGPRALADSAASGLELAAGAALTGGVGTVASIANTARKGKKAKDTFDKIKNSKGITDAAAKALKATGKATAQTSLLNADMVQGQIEEYRAEHGVDPSKAQLSTMLALNIGPAALQGKIIKDLFIPKIGKPNPSLKKFKDTMGQLAKFGNESTIKSLTRHVVQEGIPKVLVAAGAEGVQEYIQTWAQILGNNLDVDNPSNLLQSAYETLTDEENRDEAVAAAFIGVGAGGSAKTAIQAPKVGAQVTADVAKGVTKVAGNKLQKVVNKSSVDVLNDEEKESVREDFKARKTVVDQKTTEIDSQIDKLQKAKNIDEIIADDDLAVILSGAQSKTKLSDKAVRDPKNFKQIQDSLIRVLKKDKALVKTEFEASNIAKVGKMLGEKVSKKVKDKISSVDTNPDTVIGTILEASKTTGSKVKALSSEAVTAVKEIKSSAALGIIEAGLDTSKKATKKLIEQASSLSVEDLNRTAAAVAENNPALADGLRKIVQQKNKAKERFGQKTNSIINESTLSPVIKDVVAKGKIAKDNIASTGVVLSSTLAGKIDDIPTLESVRTALNSYKEAVKNNPGIAGTFNSNTIKRMEDKLNRVASRLKEQPKQKSKQNKDPEPTVDKSKARKVFSKMASIVPSLEGDGLVTAVKAFDNSVLSLKNKNQTNRQEIISLFEEFKELSDEKFKRVIDKYFPVEEDVNIKTEEAFDTVTDKQLSEAQIREAYAKDFPGCKI